MSKTNNTPKFNVGDRVKILKKVTERTPDFQNSWVERMDESIGKIVTIRRITTHGIYFNETGLGYPPASLVKVGFSSFDEVIKYMKRGGYVISELLKDVFVCYRIKKGVLEINSVNLSYQWGKSYYSITELRNYNTAGISRFTKRKYV